MRSLISCALALAAAAGAAELPYFHVLSEDAGGWPEIFTAIGYESQPEDQARVFVARAEEPAAPGWNQRVEKGAVLVLEGESPLAAMFGFRRGQGSVRATSVVDVHRPKLAIVWERSVELPVFDLPEGSRVFARERWSGTPLVAGFRRGAGAVLWVAVAPGAHGYERLPYLPAALRDLGLELPFRSSRLWAFFDSAYRARADLEYLADRWRKAGIEALHVSAWHYYEPDGERDAWLAKLIEICHRRGILVYAWLELPHVSDQFWDAHPEWREKTALLQDAELDWRKLMNLNNPDCFRAVSAGVRGLLGRFDWDGANLAELYFESLEGLGNPSRFTPMNDDVRAGFRALRGFDPLEVFGARRDAASQKAFLEYRSDLARRMQEEWLAVLESARRDKPDLDLVLTHVDDRFDTGIREAIGADAARVLPLLDQHSFTFLIEDPATVWNLGAGRYRQIAENYRALTPHREKLAIDLNIVERYQDVYPTRQQTGTELFQLVHQAAASFPRIALYFENSLLPPDLDLLPAAAAAARVARDGSKTRVESPNGVGLPWRGAASVDGQLWAAADEDTVWLPPGLHFVEPTSRAIGFRLVRLTGDLQSARVLGDTAIEFSYQSDARAIALLDRGARRARVDGVDLPASSMKGTMLLLPRGKHTAAVFCE